MYDIKALYEAKSVPDAIELLLAHPQARIIAGGSDVLVQMREGKLAGSELVSIYGLDELRGVKLEEDGTIRLYFTVEQAQKKLHRSRQSVTRIFQQLEFSGLICRRKQGLGRPAMITLNYPSNAKLIQPKEDSELPSG